MAQIKGTKYVSLADYCAMGNSEVSMKEGETVVLKKLGCAGWWYVRVLGKCHSLVSNTMFIPGKVLISCHIVEKKFCS
jgi:SH3 domain